MVTDKESEISGNSFKELRQSIWDYLMNIFSIKNEVDFENTKKGIEKDISFKGFNIWILILSIIICSIGLNVNSTAIVIGAMLISPLMGPINGIGFAIGTFNRSLLMRSINNLLIALIISIITSALFFKIAPVGEYQSELLSRTKPIFLDLIVALCGGFAGILSASRSIRTNVIPGVAIATALMPPLCTAGFGIATLNWDFFFGAAYLFFINSVFITISAMVVVRYLRFPIKTYIDKKTQKRAKAFIWIFALLVSIPSIFMYQNVLNETLFKSRMRIFINEKVLNENHSMPNPPQYFYSDSLKAATIYIYGAEITPKMRDSLTTFLVEYNLADAQIDIRNMGSMESFKNLVQYKDVELSKNVIFSDQLQEQIVQQNEQLENLTSYVDRQNAIWIDEQQLNKEAIAVFNFVDSIKYFVSRDTTKDEPQLHGGAIVHTSNKTVNKSEKDKLNNWLSIRFDTRIKEENIIYSFTPIKR